MNINDFFILEKVLNESSFSKIIKASAKQEYKYLSAYFPVVIKTFDFKLDIKNINKEALILKELSNNDKNNSLIVKFYDFFMLDNQYYLIMEYIHGYNLYDLIKLLWIEEIDNFGEKNISYTLYFKYKDNEILQFLISMTYILKFIHDNNIVHRDIKPENFMIDQKNNAIKLVDFGFSSSTVIKNDFFYEFRIQGTPDFIAPELLENIKKEDFNPEMYKKSDVWSLGITFYNFLYGKVPPEILKTENLKQLKEVLKTDISFSFNYKSDFKIIPILQKMINKDYKNRSNIEEILEELKK